MLCKGDWLALLLAAVSGTVVYSNSLHGEMVLDDLPAVVENPDVDPAKTSVFSLFRNNFWGQGMDAYDTQHQVGGSMPH